MITIDLERLRITLLDDEASAWEGSIFVGFLSLVAGLPVLFGHAFESRRGRNAIGRVTSHENAEIRRTRVRQI